MYVCRNRLLAASLASVNSRPRGRRGRRISLVKLRIVDFLEKLLILVKRHSDLLYLLCSFPRGFRCYREGARGIRTPGRIVIATAAPVQRGYLKPLGHRAMDTDQKTED